MFRSKFVTWTLLLNLTWLVASCIKPAHGPDDATVASNFIVKSLEGHGNVGQISESTVWRVPQDVIVTFNACLQERTSRVDMRSQMFHVEIPGTNKAFPSTKTSDYGCMSWDEPIPYNHFAGQSGWVLIKRDIVGEGVNRGRQTVTVAVNPWAMGDKARDTEKEVVFMRADSNFVRPARIFPEESADHALAGELQGQSQLLVQNVHVLATPIGEGDDYVTLRVEVDMDPVVRTLNAHGDAVYLPAKDGDFDLMMQVMASSVGPAKDQKVLLMGGDVHAVGKVIGTHFKAEFVLRQELKANQNVLELVMQLRPRGLHSYDSVKPFNGLFRFGTDNALAQEHGNLAMQCYVNPDSCDYETLISKAVNYDEVTQAKRKGLQKDIEDGGYVRNNVRYMFSNLKLRFTSILPGETATRRKVGYTASTCITDNQTGRPLSNTPLIVNVIKEASADDPDSEDSYQDEIMRTATQTDDSGCLIWNGSVYHRYYRPERFFVRHVVISMGGETIVNADQTKTRTSTFERNISFYLNPWDDKFTFGWDSREFTATFLKKLEEKVKNPIPSRFFLSDYSYHTVRFLYNIDPFMELEVKKWILMEFVPQVLRYSGIVNARKMVEHLRDGIYLMKVAIEKNYLDPHDNSGWLLNDQPKLQAPRESVGLSKIASKEYITTNMALVRVVDGVIVYPIELTMRDLRLMRVRSNFMIELETVDERLIQAYHVFRKHAINDQELERKLNEFKAKMKSQAGLDEVNALAGAPDDKSVAPGLEDLVRVRGSAGSGNPENPDVSASREDLEVAADNVRSQVLTAVKQLDEVYKSGHDVALQLDSNGNPTGNSLSFQPTTNNLDNFQVRPEVLKDLAQALGVNDFSRTALPRREDIDLNQFLEEKSGLEPRSFVGPVIYLSNAYSDSMRATDNLDEAHCVNPDVGADAYTQTQDLIANDPKSAANYEAKRQLLGKESSLFNARQNNAYEFNSYYGSLNNLCYSSVDKLSLREKELDARRDDVSRAAALKYNFVRAFNMEFISLTDEPLEKVKDGCDHDIKNCLEKSSDFTLPASSLDHLINNRLSEAKDWWNFNLKDNLYKRFAGIPFHVEKTSWDPSKYQDMLFTHGPESEVAACNVLANRITQQLIERKLTQMSEGLIHEKITQMCVMDGGLVHDLKLRVAETGQYTFLGGLNLNFNVGESFSVGSSSGWSGGLELTDLVGVPAAWMKSADAFKGLATGLSNVSAALKPVNLKYGSGVSKSQGTSVGESTYLVSQIAGFKVRLSSYERCAAMRLSDQSVSSLRTSWGTRGDGLTHMLGLVTADFGNQEVYDIFTRGLFVCEGATRKNNPEIEVPEAYFYFTQHFTEGDMLDQADLYNCPWLFPLRGMRDFAVFVDKIRAQDNADLDAFVSYEFGLNQPHMKGWALEHLKNAYHQVMPSFPGYYTVLDRGEPTINFFALNQVDPDPNQEVNHPLLKPDRAAIMKRPEVPPELKPAPGSVLKHGSPELQ